MMIHVFDIDPGPTSVSGISNHNTIAMVNVVTHRNMVDKHSVLLNEYDLSTHLNRELHLLSSSLTWQFQMFPGQKKRHVWDYPSPAALPHPNPGV
jgi:hypothetical protein